MKTDYLPSILRREFGQIRTPARKTSLPKATSTVWIPEAANIVTLKLKDDEDDEIDAKKSGGGKTSKKDVNSKSATVGKPTVRQASFPRMKTSMTRLADPFSGTFPPPPTRDSAYRFDLSFPVHPVAIAKPRQVKLLADDTVPEWASSLPLVHPVCRLFQRGCFAVDSSVRSAAAAAGGSAVAAAATRRNANRIRLLMNRNSVAAATAAAESKKEKFSVEEHVAAEEEGIRIPEMARMTSSMPSFILKECSAPVLTRDLNVRLRALKVERETTSTHRCCEPPKPEVDHPGPSISVTAAKVRLESKRPSAVRSASQRVMGKRNGGLSTRGESGQHCSYYPNPLIGCSRPYSRRLAELARLQFETIRWEATTNVRRGTGVNGGGGNNSRRFTTAT